MARPDVDTTKLEIRPISSTDETSTFSCGDDDLDGFLREDAMRLHDLGIVRVYLAIYDGQLVGYFAILADAIRLKTPEIKRLRMNHEDPPGVPALKVGRLAVSLEFKKKYRGLGTAMMGYAFAIGTLIAGHAGCRLITVDAYRQSVEFYEKLKFVCNKKKASEEDKIAQPADGGGGTIYVPANDCVSMRFDLKTDPLPDWCLGGSEES
jgi:hypothetical protein